MSTADAGRIRVVLVDDHPIVRDGLMGVLASDPRLEVVGEAASGPEAVAVARCTAPDVVVMDLRMPGGDGVAAIRELAARAGGAAHAEPAEPVGPNTPPRFLVLTTYDTDRDILAAMNAGATGFLLKDVPRADLLRAVHDVAAGRPVLTPRAVEALAGRGREMEELTEREAQVLRAIADGGTNASAARRLMISEATVKSHLARAYAKLGVSDRAAAVRVALERGIV